MNVRIKLQKTEIVEITIMSCFGQVRVFIS